ncbi:MAG: hypothetical protein ACFFC9_10595, partial [Promethearchaeota archaeon]
MEKKSKLLILFMVGLVFVLITVANSNTQINYDNSNSKLSNGQISVTPIFIDDEDPNFNWSKIAENAWCSGLGTWDNPYIIENVIIDGYGSSYCIKIQNSSKYFVLKNNIFF